MSSLVRPSVTLSCHVGSGCHVLQGRAARTEHTCGCSASGQDAQPGGRDFDAAANNSVGSDRDSSGSATYRGITSAGRLRCFPASEACNPRSLKHPGTDADLPVGRPPVANPSLQRPLCTARPRRESREIWRSVRVRVNDFGPYVVGRSLDLSLALAPRKQLASSGKE